MSRSTMSSWPFVAVQLTLLTIAIGLSSQEEVNKQEQEDGDVFYKVPNPFEQANQDLYFSIKSTQLTLSSHHRSAKTNVEEFFSLKAGVSYSIHTDIDNSDESYVLITDSSRLRSYVVRNPGASKEEPVDCELDHVHNHRSVFPWQFTFSTQPKSDEIATKDDDVKQDSKESSRRRKNRRGKLTGIRSVYGAGAVWLNVIQRNLASEKVGKKSPYEDSNLWQMTEGDIEVKMLFNKPDTTEDMSRDEVARLIESSVINQIQIKRLNSLQKDHEFDGFSAIAESMDFININAIETNIEASDERLSHLFWLLNRCRSSTKKHRLFPSLIRELSLSPDQMFLIGYVQRRSSLLANDDDDQSYHEQYSNRIVHNRELVNEWFSFKRQAQVTTYESAAGRLPVSQPENLDRPKQDETVDIFLKAFTEYGGPRSSRHSTAHYHFQELDGEVTNCWPGQKEPAPLWFKQLIRAVYFRRPGGSTISGQLTGLGALLMNAADAHYKEFSLFRREIDILYDPSNLDARRTVKADEWQFYDRKTKFLVMFYFARVNGVSTSIIENRDMKITDLVRVDILDTCAQIPDDDVPLSSRVDADSFDLLIRYEVMFFETVIDPDRIEFVFETPAECLNSNQTSMQPENQENDSDDEEEVYDTNEQDDLMNYDADDDDDEDTDSDLEEAHDRKNDQKLGEEFEFDQGRMTEDFPFPEFFSYLQDHNSYKIMTSIELTSDRDTQSANRIYLNELVDLEIGLAKIQMFKTKESLDDNKPDVQFFFNYNMDIIMRHKSTGENELCEQVDRVDPWLRILSAELDYLRRYPDSRPVKTKTRLYGIGALWRRASISELTYFLGAREYEPKQDDKCQYRQFVWASNLEEDMDMRFEFGFLWNATKFKENRAVSKKSMPSELLTIGHIDIKAEPNFEFTGFDSSRETLFKSARLVPWASFIKLTQDDYVTMSMPKSCADALRSNMENNHEQKSVFNRQDFEQLPSFWDFIKPTNSYSVTYTVTHSPGPQSRASASNEPLQSTTISEFFDRSANLGKLVIGFGTGTREIYIDSNKRSIYSYVSNLGKCKRLANLPGLLDTKSQFETLNEDFNMDKMYALAALWIQMSEIKSLKLIDASIELLPDGKNLETRSFQTSEQFGSSDGSKVGFTLTAKFVYAYQASRRSIAKSNEFKLKSLSFTPRFMHSHSSRLPLYKTQVEVNKLNASSPLDWQLPDECRLLEDNTPSGPIHSVFQFPRLTMSMRAGTTFHLRAEVALNLDSSSKTKVYTTDETVHDNDVRFKTKGLDQDIDLLLYSGTGEIFDLGQPFNCPNRLPKFELQTTADTNGFHEFWSGNKVTIKDLAEVYYAPLSLWRLAELNLHTVSLASSMELAPETPLKDNLDGTMDSLDREMRTDIWTVKGPEFNGNPSAWSYDMHFERIVAKAEDGKMRQLQVLQKIQLYLGKRPLKGDPAKCQLEIAVLNYRYNQTGEEYKDRFILPEGKMCVRNDKALRSLNQVRDTIGVKWDDNYLFWYQASLELVEGHNGLVLPTISGHIFRSSRKGEEISLLSHYHETHYPNGTSRARRVVTDSWNDIQFDIDQHSGQCSITREVSADWTIRFPLDEVSHISLIMDEFAELDMLRSESSLPVSRYTFNGYEVQTYELSLPSLFSKLDPIAKSLDGPVTITKKYFSPLWKQGMSLGPQDSTLTRIHSEVTIGVHVYNSDRTKLVGKLNYLIRGLNNAPMTEIVRHMDVSQCNEDDGRNPELQVRHFAIDYKCNFDPQRNQRFNRSSALELFTLSLMKTDGLLPTQLKGAPRMLLDSAGKIRFAFELIEPPTAINYGPKIIAESRMSENLEYLSEMKLSSSARGCSDWCDLVNCVAMAYCGDRTCRVVSQKMLCQDKEDCQPDLEVKNLAQHGVQADDCKFFYWPKGRAPRLDSFVSKLTSLLNVRRDTTTLMHMSINLEPPIYETILPINFVELDHDNIAGLDKDESGRQSTDESLFKTSRFNEIITVKKMQELASRKKRDIKFSLAHTSNGFSCLSEADSSYQLVSYCKSNGYCLVVQELLSRQELAEVLSPEQEAGASSCSILVRDNLASYDVFEGVMAPKSRQLLVEDISANECAAICDQHTQADSTQSSPFACLSFDHCTKKGTEDLGTCHLQKTHVAASDFDRAIFEPYWMTNERVPSELKCDHYSKSILADFRHQPSKEFQESQRQKYVELILKGYSAGACAASCQEDETCSAFEYCFDPEQAPTQSCRIMRKPVDSLNSTKGQTLDDIMTQLRYSETCSVYILGGRQDSFRSLVARNVITLKGDESPELSGEASHLIRIFVSRTVSVVLAVALGFLIQFSHMKLLGRSLAIPGRI